MKLSSCLKYFGSFLLWVLFPFIIHGQINITFPTSRIVFQRDNLGNGVVYITGHYAQNVDRVEARLIPMVPGQGEQTDWRLIQQNPQGGFYSGNITARGGWYELQVRGVSNGVTIGTTELQRVGIGEVFLVAGQSNAQGFFNYGAPTPGDDRVNCVSYRNTTDQNSSFPVPTFAKMSDNGNVGPRGLSPWYWGRLGDILTSRLNVPILFYNAAWEGTASKNWSETVDGGTTKSIYIDASYAPGQPYANLRLALNYYASLTGVRAILWHQGEADNILNTTSNVYVSNLQTVINKSRQHFGKIVGWVVARASYYNAKKVNQQIIDGQNQTVLNNQAVFFGPNTDNIQIPRLDGAHFQNEGLIDAGNAWAAALDDNFFNNCFPQTGSFPSFSVNCAGGNQLNINVQGAFTSVQWSNGAVGASVNFGPGSYQAILRDASGNVIYTPTITVPNDVQSSPVNITLDGKLPLCQGSSIGLVSSSPIDNAWNTGATDRRIEVSAAGTYTVSTKNLYGCNSSATVTVTTVNSPPPAKPTIAASGTLSFCQGGAVSLTSSAAAEYRWSNGERGQTVTARDGGVYELRVLDAQGCISEPNSVTVQVNIPPAAPTIIASGATTFCEGGQVILSSNYPNGNNWSTGEQAKDITVSKSGTYNVRFRDINGCDGISNNIVVTVNPLPTRPTITPERPITFCEGDYTVLTSNNAAQYNWNNGERSRRIEPRTAGTYSLTVTDGNGCTSTPSEEIKVKVNALPAPPTISADRNPNICENEVITLTSSQQTGYIWSNGQNTRTITVNLTGQYAARTVDANQCQSPSSNVIAVVVNRLPAKPTITAQGPTTFCEGGQVFLSTNYATGISWNTFQTTQIIAATKGGDYRVRYKDSNGCESVSDAFIVTVNALPVAPSVINERPTSFCMFDYTVLTITSGGSIFSWSNGESGRSMKTYSAGDITARVYEPSTGCMSLPSPPIRLTVNPLPAKPTITASGLTTICADKNVTLSAPQSNGYRWSNNATTRNISVNNAGNYTLAVSNEFGCFSPESDAIAIKVNQLPNTPSVIAEGRTTFCEGEQVGLRVENLYQVEWNTGEKTNRIVAKQSGNYAARVIDEIGCQSPFSGAVRVEAKTLPPTPVLRKIGIYTLQVINDIPSAVYVWKYNDQVINKTTSLIKTNQVGVYTVTASIEHSPTLTCISKPSAGFNFVLEPSTTGLGVYPNPSLDGKVTVETLENLTNATLVIYDLTGKPVFETAMPALNDQIQFDFSFLPIGAYYIQVKSDNFKQGQKIVIQAP